MPATPLTAGYASLPYWWDDARSDGASPDGASPDGTTGNDRVEPLPSSADVVVVGGGYTGLAAAIELGRSQLEVVVVDRDEMASGASSRNGGMVHPGCGADLDELLALKGGLDLWTDTVTACVELEKFVEESGIDCAWHRSGHLELAHHDRALERLRRLAHAYETIGEPARLLERDEVGDEIGSDAFLGGVLVERSASVHPGRLAAGLFDLARASGAVLHPRCEALRVERRRMGGFVVSTTLGDIECRHVVSATDGATHRRPVAGLHRRVLPVRSYILATEPLLPGLAASVSPRGRMFFDTRNFLSYWRLSPDGTRILFGGRTSLAPSSVERARDLLYRSMIRVHPQLEGVAVDRAWGGKLALTADRLPHVGRHRASGVVYSMGYGGTGVALSIHFGRRVGSWLAGEGELPPFAAREWPRIPWPARVPWMPWMLPAAGIWWRARDHFGR